MLNIHLHCLVLDGVYRSSEGEPIFHEVRGPTAAELETLLSRIIQRILKLLTRTGYLIEEQGMTYLAQAESDRALTPLQTAACTYDNSGLLLRVETVITNPEEFRVR